MKQRKGIFNAPNFMHPLYMHRKIEITIKVLASACVQKRQITELLQYNKMIPYNFVL